MAAVPFALAPALINDQVIDYSTSEGSKLYKSAIAKLSGENQFGCEPAGLKVFLALVKARSQVTGWEAILAIPADADEDPDEELLNLLDHYGQRSMDQIKKLAYIYSGTKTRAAQDSAQLYYSLINSLSENGIAKVMICSEEFTLEGIPSGPLLLKVIIRESHIDTNATTRHIREKLSSLDGYLKEVGNDVVKMNEHTKGLLISLKARGETTEDLISNLFKAYKSVPDKNFARYIQSKEDEYDEGIMHTPEALMQRASNKYRTLVEDHLWNAPSDEDQKILALQARIDRMSTQEYKPKRGTDTNKNKDRDPSVKKTKPQWMLEAPEAGKELVAKRVNEKDYYWCTALNCWCRHTPEQCQQKSKQPGDKPKESRRERMIKAAQALLEDAESEEDSE